MTLSLDPLTRYPPSQYYFLVSLTPDNPELTNFFDIPPALAAAVEPPSPPSRESAYIGKAESNLYAARKKRRNELIGTATRKAIERATERLTTLAHPDLDYIVIRSRFIYGSRVPLRPCMDGAEDLPLILPPLSQALSSKNQYAIGLYVTLLFIRQMDAFRSAAGDPATTGIRRRKSVYNVGDYSEASLIGLPSTDRRAQRLAFNRALAALQKAELIDYGPGAQRYATYRLNSEDGSGHAYTVPTGDPDSPQYLCLPTEFVTAGWPMVLTPSEMATFLAICHFADRKLPRNADGKTPRRIYLAKSERDTQFGLSDEAYESIHTLAEFGLIDLHDPVDDRRRGRVAPRHTGGKLPDPYLLDPIILGGYPSHERVFNLDVFNRPAIEVAIDQLSRPMPRYAMWSGSSRKRDEARAAKKTTMASHDAAPQTHIG